MKPNRFYLPGLEGKPEGLVLYGPTHFNVDTDDYSVICLPGGNSAVMVKSEYATPEFIKTRGTKEKWHDVAKWVFGYGWNFEDDCPWSLSPVETYIFTVKGKDLYFFYGTSRTQSEDFPYHKLGFLQNPHGEIIIVDKACLNPEFMTQMGPDWQKWIDISWAHIASPNVAFNSREWPLTAAILPPILPSFD